MYRTGGSLQPTQVDSQESSKKNPDVQNDTFEGHMTEIVTNHLTKIKPFESLCARQDSSKSQTAEAERSVYAVLQKDITQPTKVSKIIKQNLVEKENSDEELSDGHENESEKKTCLSQDIEKLDVATTTENISNNGNEKTDDEFQTYATIDEEKLPEDKERSQSKKRHYKILRYDDSGKKSVVTIHVTTEEGEIDDEEGQIIAMDALQQERKSGKEMQGEEMVAITALENSFREETARSQQHTPLVKKPSALLRMKQTFSPKKILNVKPEKEEQHDDQGSPAKTPKSPRQIFQSFMTWNKEHIKAAHKFEKPSTGEFISARKHTAYYEDDDVYTWAYGGYEKRIEIREKRDKTSVPYITVQNQADGGKIFTSDRVAKCIRIYTADGTYIQTTTCLSSPLGIEIYDSNTIACAYPNDHSIAMLDLTKMVQYQTVRSKNLKMPRGIAINPLQVGAIAVTDVQNLQECSIKVFDIKSGKLAHTICPNSAMFSKFGWTEFITYGRNDKNYLYVSDSWKHQVYGFDLRRPDNPVIEFGEQGTRQGCISNPCGIAFLPENVLYPNGSIILSDWYSDRVPAFDPDTGDLQQYILTERFGSPTPIQSPYDLAVNEKGTIFASESSSNYIKVFNRQDSDVLRAEEEYELGAPSNA